MNNERSRTMDTTSLFPQSEELYQAWRLHKEAVREAEFQKYADLLFTYLEDTVLEKERVDAFFKELMEKCSAADNQRDLYVDIWSYKSALNRKHDAIVTDRCTRLSVETEERVVVPPMEVTKIATMTDLLHRIASLFGSKFWVSIQSVPLPEREDSFGWNNMFRLEYWPDGLPEKRAKQVQAAYRKYHYEHDTYQHPWMSKIVVTEPSC